PPGIAAEHLGEPAHLDVRVESGWVDLLVRRSEQQVDALRLEQLRVAALIAGVCIEVLFRPELLRVHEQRDDHDVAVAARAPNQGEVALVKRSHRGYEADPPRLREGFAD